MPTQSVMLLQIPQLPDLQMRTFPSRMAATIWNQAVMTLPSTSQCLAKVPASAVETRAIAMRVDGHVVELGNAQTRQKIEGQVKASELICRPGES
jgi:predicted lipoprotein